ncbi:MAG: hypothetical protein Tsb002_34330 [Wenzhouxiangellaceae bacterium]
MITRFALIGLCAMLIPVQAICQDKFGSPASADQKQDQPLTVDEPGAALRLYLLDVLAFLDRVAPVNEADQEDQIRQWFSRYLTALDPHTLDQLAAISPPLNTMQQRLDLAQQQYELALLLDDQRDADPIVFPTPQPTVAACAGVRSTQALATFSTWGVVREAIAAAKWECLQTVLGENSATACTPLNILSTSLEFAFRGEEACLTEQRDATAVALFQTQKNIANYLNGQLDQPLSSRANGEDFAQLASDINQAQQLLSTLQSTLNSDFSSAELQLSSVNQDLQSLAQSVGALTAALNDIRFRIQETQVDIEDAQQRAAQAQALSGEIRGDTQQLRTRLLTLHAALNNLGATVDARLSGLRRTAYGESLANPQARVFRYQLPLALGGELERSRDVLIESIIAFDQLGAKTSAAEALLMQGDAAYNQQNYLQAYQLFAQGYRALVAPQRSSEND